MARCRAKKGVVELAAFLTCRIEAGELRLCDPQVAARHLMALLNSETVSLCLLGVKKKPTATFIRQAVERALDTFLLGYAPRP
ncbi:TetR/AcrR family transcriptional regulator C-terminal domain-containing protein [Pseudomonas sp. S11A4]|uniref:TetR/AcrR family transcriptional regulator C-terminal domain-containing protein n=1 Tax=unclassified Pseudomonas TaxID=196821 RepID=UPI00406CE32E